MGREFKLVQDQEFDLEVKKKPKSGTFSIFEAMPDAEEDESTGIFTLSSDVYDYDDIEFKTILSATSYAATKGFDCQIDRNGSPYGYWSSLEGFRRIYGMKNKEQKQREGLLDECIITHKNICPHSVISGEKCSKCIIPDKQRDTGCLNKQ